MARHVGMGTAASVACAVFVAPAPVATAAEGPPMVQLVFQLASPPKAAPALPVAGLDLAGVPGATWRALPGDRWALEVPAARAAAVARDLAHRPRVRYVSGAAAVKAASTLVPDNPCYDSACGPTQPVVVEEPSLGAGETVVHPDGQTDLWAINASQAWAVTKGSSSIVVAVLDTGVDPDQVQLAHKVEVGPDLCAWDMPACSSDSDNNGHGTFVSGLIAADTNDGIGIAGLGWNTRVLDIKVLNDLGNGNTTDQDTGIYDAVAAGARVINLSSTDQPCGPGVPAGSCGPLPDQEAAVEYAIAHGVVVVAAAGNGQPLGSDKPVYPADYPGVLSVAASTDQGVVNPDNGGPYLDFSNYGRDANIAAPGINVLSTWYDGNYAVGSGTSYAAPHVAAAAALVMAADPRLSGPQVATLLLETAAPLGAGGERINGGFLDVGAAVEAAAQAYAAHKEISPTLEGYQLAGRDASTYSFGTVASGGCPTWHSPPCPAGHRLAHPIVAVAEAPQGLGYWLVSSDGGVFAIGDAPYYGSAAHRSLARPAVGIAAAPDGHGYWLVTAGGAVYGFGDAHVYGSLATRPPAKKVVGVAATPDGHGYWLVTAGGAVYGFGDAHTYGSAAKVRLRKPVVGMAASPDGRGYWLVASDGGVFNFGDAGYFGSAAAGRAGQPIVGIAAAPDGRGYWLAGTKGKVWAFGSAPDVVTQTARTPSAPIVAISS